MVKKLIIWDFDGVIADTEKLWLKNRQILMKKLLNVDWDWQTVNHYLRGTGDKTKRDVLDNLGIVTNDDFWNKSIEMDIYTMNTQGFELTPDIEQIFKLPIKQCIATGGVKDKTALKIKITGISSYFPALMLCVPLSGGSGPGPWPPPDSWCREEWRSCRISSLSSAWPAVFSPPAPGLRHPFHGAFPPPPYP